MVEITRMSKADGSGEKEIAKIRDIVSSLQMLHQADSSEYDKIAEAYDDVQIPELQNGKGDFYEQK
jgi:hypothetical protein